MTINNLEDRLLDEYFRWRGDFSMNPDRDPKVFLDKIKQMIDADLPKQKGNNVLAK